MTLCDEINNPLLCWLIAWYWTCIFLKLHHKVLQVPQICLPFKSKDERWILLNLDSITPELINVWEPFDIPNRSDGLFLKMSSILRLLHNILIIISCKCFMSVLSLWLLEVTLIWDAVSNWEWIRLVSFIWFESIHFVKPWYGYARCSISDSCVRGIIPFYLFSIEDIGLLEYWHSIGINQNRVICITKLRVHHLWATLWLHLSFLGSLLSTELAEHTWFHIVHLRQKSWVIEFRFLFFL